MPIFPRTEGCFTDAGVSQPLLGVSFFDDSNLVASFGALPALRLVRETDLRDVVIHRIRIFVDEQAGSGMVTGAVSNVIAKMFITSLASIPMKYSYFLSLWS